MSKTFSPFTGPMMYLLGQEAGGQLAGRRAAFSTLGICAYATTLSTLHNRRYLSMVLCLVIHVSCIYLGGPCEVSHQP